MCGVRGRQDERMCAAPGVWGGTGEGAQGEALADDMRWREPAVAGERRGSGRR